MRSVAPAFAVALAAAAPAGAAPRPDAGFGAGGRALQPFSQWAAQPFAVAALDDGRTAVAAAPGSFDDTGAGGQAIVGVLDAAGRRDPAFSDDGVAVVGAGATGLPDSLGVVVAAPDGRVLAGGSTDNRPSGRNAAIVVALRRDGTPDPAFGVGGVARIALGASARNAQVARIALAPDGAIVVAGGAQRPGRFVDAFVARLRADGRPDRSFRARWIPFAAGRRFDSAEGLAVLRDGRIVVAGSVETGGRASGDVDVDTRDFDWGVARLTRRGRLDRAFSRDGIARVPMGAEPRGARDRDFLRGLFAARGGGLRLAGGVDGGGLGVAALRADGRLDRRFGADGRALVDGPLFAAGAALDAGGGVVIVGERRPPGQLGAPVLARITAAGSLDPSFGVFAFELGAGAGFARAVAAGPSDTLTVAGDDAVTRFVTS